MVELTEEGHHYGVRGWAHRDPVILRYLWLVVAERGLDLQPALSRHGLGPEVLGAPELRVSFRQTSDVIAAAIALTGDPGLGLAVGARQQLPAWGFVGLGLQTSGTLGEAIELGLRHQHASGAMASWKLVRDGDALAIEVSPLHPAVEPAVEAFLVDEAFASVVASIRHAVDEAFAPDAVHLAFPRPAHAERHAQLFRCDVRYEAASSRCVLAHRWTRKALAGRDRWTLAKVLQHLDDPAAQDQQQDLPSVMATAVEQALPHLLALTDHAERLHVSERTLRRQLTASGTTYSALVDGVRRRRCEHLLSDPALTIRTIAHELGFSDERTLRRAVKRWFDSTPTAVRNAALLAAGGSDAQGP